MNKIELNHIEALAAFARRFDTEEHYGSEIAILAENSLADAIIPHLREEAAERLEHYCLKATYGEIIETFLEAAKAASKP